MYIYVRALNKTASCIIQFIFWEAHNLIKLGRELVICPMTIGQGSDA